MSSKNVNIVVSGVGGQGVILVAEILGDAALAEGLEVIVSEIHGMAQRGGSVVSHVRIGCGIYSPTMIEGSADVLLGFEPIETLRALRFANQNTQIVMSTKAVIPVTVSTGAYRYPSLEEIVEECRWFTEHVIIVDAFKIAEEAGSMKAMNIVLLGALEATGILPVKKDTLIQTIKGHVPEELLKVNLKAFEAGKQVVLST